MKHDHPQFKLRIPPKLKEALEQEAARHDRTLTAEIIGRLEGSFATTSFPARDSNDMDAMVGISIAQMEFHMAQNQVAQAREEFSRAQIRYDALVIQEHASSPLDPLSHAAREMKERRLAALDDADRAKMKLKEAEAALQIAQQRLSESHAARMRDVAR